MPQIDLHQESGLANQSLSRNLSHVEVQESSDQRDSIHVSEAQPRSSLNQVQNQPSFKIGKRHFFILCLNRPCPKQKKGQKCCQFRHTTEKQKKSRHSKLKSKISFRDN